ncbi:MAG: hypothetical protein MMC33_005968 [Icmadophila ericetorum]|nr:hypothetical protein [Icmadophila ericetorum]
MTETLDSIKEDDSETETDASRPVAPHLPVEIVLRIVYFVREPKKQATLHAATLVSRSWYSAAIRDLYEKPRIMSPNYNRFVTTICPSINPHVRKTELAGMVRALDLSHIIHDGSKSMTARLLGRVKGTVMVFVAPQASFGINCLAPLSKCQNLKTLDLSWVSAPISMRAMLHSIRHLSQLTSLMLPRSAYASEEPPNADSQWPLRLEVLRINGNLRRSTVEYFSNLPASLRYLCVDNCPQAERSVVEELIGYVRHQLRSLHLGHNMRLESGDYDLVLQAAPNLLRLTIPLDFITENFFAACIIAGLDSAEQCPLVSLTFDASELEVGIDKESDALFCALCDGGLPCLRQARFTTRVWWTKSEKGERDMEELGEYLEALDREDKVKSGMRAGAYLIEAYDFCRNDYLEDCMTESNSGFA